MSTAAPFFWSAPAGITHEQREAFQHWTAAMPVPWLGARLDGIKLVLQDDAGGEVVLLFDRSRPSGEVPGPVSAKLWLGLLRTAQLLQLTVSTSDARAVTPADLDAAFAASPAGLDRDAFEELAFALGLCPLAFRVRHLAIANSGGGVVF